jgi:hypothetical protein
VDKTYRFKDLIELVPFASKGRSLTWDVFGDGLIEYVSDRDGVWLCKHGRGLNEGAGTGLVGLAHDDVAERNIEGVGVVYGMKDGTPLLPLPYFTAHELMIFNSRTAGMITRCNERGENESEWLAELGQMNPDAEELAQVILYGYLPGNAELYSAKAPPAAGAASAEPETQSKPLPTDAGTVPLQKQRAQEIKILQLLKEKGHDPLKLPTRDKGKRGIKSEIRVIALAAKPVIFTINSFDKAWQRLRDGCEIGGGE